MGLHASISAECVEFGRQQRHVERFRPREPAPRLYPPPSGRRDHAGVQKEPTVCGLRREGPFHRGACFVGPAGGHERPAVGVFSEDVLADQQLVFAERERLLDVDMAGREE